LAAVAEDAIAAVVVRAAARVDRAGMVDEIADPGSS
jgi:hypothetical protein